MSWSPNVAEDQDLEVGVMRLQGSIVSYFVQYQGYRNPPE